MEIRNKIVVAMALAFVVVAIVPVFAYMYFWQSEPKQIQSGIILQTHPNVEMQLGIYWDEACTQNVTTIDFGKMVHPNQEILLDKVMWIRNEGNVSHTLYWNSTLSSVTTEISDEWGYTSYMSPINGTTLNPSFAYQTVYRLHVPAYSTVGTYNWTLTVWAEYTY